MFVPRVLANNLPSLEIESNARAVSWHRGSSIRYFLFKRLVHQWHPNTREICLTKLKYYHSLLNTHQNNVQPLMLSILRLFPGWFSSTESISFFTETGELESGEPPHL